MDIAVERRYCAWRLVRWVFACAVEVTRRSDSEGGAGPRAANGNGTKWQKYAMTLSCDPRRRGVRYGRCKRCRCATRMLRLSRWAVACAVWGALLRGPGSRGACRRRAVRSRRAGAACELGTCYLELARTGRGGARGGDSVSLVNVTLLSIIMWRCLMPRARLERMVPSRHGHV